jgi:iron complex transport system substrate-binding protein
MPRFVWGFFCVFLANSRQGRFVSASTKDFFTRALLVCSGFLLFYVPYAAAQSNTPAAPVPPAMHDVIDGYGRSVHLPVNPSRVISLAPSLTETVYALGVEDRLVGDTDYCDYPPDAQKKPKVGGVINPNLERIAALHPDLVLLTKEGNLLETVRALDTLGIPTYATDAHTIDQIISSTQKLADVLNVTEDGKALTADLQQRLNALQTKLGGVPPKRVLFVVWPEPLMSVGKNTFVADALRRAGAVSIVDSNQDWPQVSLEEVARLQPEDLIFAPSHSGASGNEIDAVANRPGWEILDAVRNRRFAVASDAIIRPAPRIVSVIEDLARQLHPELFDDKPGMEKEFPPANVTPSEPSAPQPKPNSTGAAGPHGAAESLCAR